MHKWFGKRLLWASTKPFGYPLFSYRNNLIMNGKLPCADLEILQFTRLQSLLKYAVENSPYYNQLFNDHGINVNKISSFDDLKKIPLLSKSILNESSTSILTTPSLRGLKIVKTSGSMGIPLRFYKDKAAVASTYAAMYRGHFWHGADIGEREARLWSVPSGFSGSFKYKSIDLLTNRFRQHSINLSDRVFHAFYETMKKNHPSYLMGYPSLLHAFSQFATEHNLDCKKLNLKFVKFTGEMITEHQRIKIQDCFGCQCVSEYGSAETGIISFECTNGNNHIMSDCVYVEFLEDSSLPLGTFKLVVTNLHNYAFPIIRYEIGDLSAPIGGKCDCGVELPLMSDVVGRQHDYIFGLNTQKFHSSVFSNIIKKYLGRELLGREIQFLQREAGKVEVIVSCDFDSIQFIEKKLKECSQIDFNGAIVFDIQMVDSVPADPSGKYRYFISLLAK